MRGIKKRILALVLSFALAITMLPAVEPVEVKAAGNTVYYNFTNYTSCTNGTTYLFVPTDKNITDMQDFCLTALPTGSAILKALSFSDAQTEFANSTSRDSPVNDSSFNQQVLVIQAGAGFDNHNGALRKNSNGTFTYKCTGGGERGTGYLYTYTSTTLDTNMVSASINEGVAINENGATTLDKNHITMKIKINNKAYKVQDYEFSDHTVNKATKDNLLTVKFAGVSVNIPVKFKLLTSDFTMKPTSGSKINIAGSAKNVQVNTNTTYTPAEMGTMTVAYYNNATGTKLAEAPAVPGTYTVKVSTTGGTLFNPVMDLELGTYTIEHVYDKNKATCEWATDYSQATLSIPCAFCEDVKKLTATSTIASSTATCLTKGTIKYQVTFKGQAGASKTDWYQVNYDTETANGEDYTYYKEDFNMEPHAMTPVAYQEPTCTEKGKAAHYQCSKCGYLYAYDDGNYEVTEGEITIDALGHDYGELVSYLDPTCTVDGHEAYYQCGRCNNYFNEAKAPTTFDKLKIDKNGHNLISYSGRAATCTDEGSQPYWECSVCKALFSDEGGTQTTTTEALKIAPLGHQFTLTPYQAPTCTTSGNKASLTCSVCHKTFGCTNEQLTDDQTDAVNTEKADKKNSKNSLTTAQKSRLTIAALGHDYSEKQNNTESIIDSATCEENAWATYTYKCTRCISTQLGVKEEIPNTKLGHDFGAPSCVWAADESSCTAKFTCQRSGCAKNTTPVTLIAYADKVNNRADGIAKQITSSTTATCTVGGIRTYKAEFAPYNDAKGEVYYEALDTKNDPALGHKLTYTEGVDATCETAGTKAYWTCSRQCDYGSNCGLHFAAADNHEDAANQAADAENLRLEGTTSAKYISALETWKVIPALHHAYGNPVYDWSADGKTVMVTYTCANNDAHKITIQGSTQVTNENKTDTDVPVTSSVKQAPTCTAVGTTTYSISGTYPATTYSVALDYSNTKDVKDIPATNHDYKLKNTSDAEDFDWLKDQTTREMTAKATFICEKDEAHKATHEVSVTSAVTTPATCEGAGERTYTGKVTFNGQVYTKTKTEEIPALGHAYGQPVFTWSDDGKTATATFTCGNDKTHKVTQDATVTKEIIKQPTCLAVGTTKYTATVSFDNKEYTVSTTRNDISATGHSLTPTAAVAATCTEKGNIAYWYCSSCKKYLANGAADGTTEIDDINGDGVATIVDTILAAKGHTVVTDAKVEPACEEAGKTEGTHCAVCETVLKAQDEIPKLGHTYGEPEFAWSDDGKTATATFTCSHDTSHKQTLNATVTSDVETPAGCLTDGVTAYYATVTFLGKHYSDIQIVRDLTANGHSLIHVEAVDPTCVTKGNIEYWYCESCNKYFAQSGEKTVVEINDTNKDGVVTKADTILAETGHKLSYQKFVAPVCEKNGYRESWYCVRCEKYFADTNAERLLTDENGESVSNNEIPETGHSYDYTAPVYIWEEDGKAATVICTCGNDENHEDSHDCEITSVVKIPATCTQEGVTTYTAKASVSENGIEYVFTDTKDVTDIPALGHREVLDAAVPATCTKDGKTEGSHCGVCQDVLKPQAVVEKTGHSFTEYIPDGNATQGQDGTKTAICDHGCGAADTIIDVGSAIALQNQLVAKARQESVAEIKEKLGVDEKTAQTIEDIKQKFKIKQEIITLTDEAVQNSTNIKGDAFGMLQARTTKLKKNSITVKWTKVKGADGYIVYGCRCKRNATYKKLKEFKGNKNFSFTNKKLASGTYYKYIVVAYKNVDGARVTLGVSKSVHATTTGGKNGVAESIKIKKVGSRKNARSVTLKVGETAQITAVEIEEDKPIKHHRGISYESGNSDVATVTSKGLIRANGTGKCKIYVYAQNGVYKTVNVTVK